MPLDGNKPKLVGRRLAEPILARLRELFVAFLLAEVNLKPATRSLILTGFQPGGLRALEFFNRFNGFRVLQWSSPG